MFPLSVMRFRLELMPCFAGCTKQKLPTTSTIQNSLSPVAASMIFSVVGSSIRVVYFTLARMGTMSWEWYCTVRADSCAKAPIEEKTKAQLMTSFRYRMPALLSGWCSRLIRPAHEAGMDDLRQVGEARPQYRSGRS